MARARNKTSVLFLNTAKDPMLGAGPFLHSQVLRFLDRDDHTLVCACSPEGPLYQRVRQIPDVEIRPVDFGPDRFGAALRGSWRSRLGAVAGFFHLIRSVLGLAVFIRRRRIDVIHTDERPRDAMATVLLGWVTGARTIIHMHVNYGDWMSPALKWALKRADLAVAVSDFVDESLLTSPYKPRATAVVLNAIDLAGWTPGDSRDAIRREFDVADGAPVVLIVCRVIPGKGADDLVKAVPRLRDIAPDLRLFIVGGDQDIAPTFRQQLSELAAGLGVADNVVLTGRRSDVPQLMAAADIFSMPSAGEPFGLVYLEAMATELPVVALRSGGVTHIVAHDDTGLLSDPGDFEAFVANLRALVADRDRRAAMGTRGRRRVEEHFDMPRMAADTAAVYRRLLGRRPTQAASGPSTRSSQQSRQYG